MAYKPKPIKTTVGAAIGDGFSEIQALAEEVREIFDNMDGANMGHMPKCELAGETADELENHVDEPDVPDFLADLVVETVEMVNRDKRKGPSRATRLSNAQALLSGAVDALNAFAESADADLEPSDDDAKVDEKEDAAEDHKEAAEQLVQELEEHTDFDVEFPGMYG